MNTLIIILLVLMVWCLISIPAYLIAALMAMGGNSASKVLLFLAAPVLVFAFGREYILDLFKKEKK